MSSALAFIPRSAGQKRKKPVAQASATLPGTSTPTSVPVLPTDDGDTSKLRDAAVLLALAFSNYSLWRNPDLRLEIHRSSSRFIPLPKFLQLSGFDALDITENFAARALRSHATTIINVRMVLSPPNWPGTIQRKAQGMYEVCRKDGMTDEDMAEYSKEYWEQRTLYLERLPPSARSIPEIWSWLHNILDGTAAEPELSSDRIQSITLPSHHLDKEGEQPKAKGFAFVTLSRIEDCSSLLSSWPWDRASDPHAAEAQPSIMQEAHKFGFRTLSKSRWNILEQEYLAYRTRLVQQLPRAPEQHQETISSDVEPEESIRGQPLHAEEPSQHNAPQTDASSPYPKDCLVFVRHICTDTNKTTLKTLFGRAFASSASGDVPGVDYVDFSKGLDSCHIRLSSPQHTKTLVGYFTSNPTVQSHGLDSQGSSDQSPNDKVITLELVDGKREELYWNKVPEKVRRGAVARAVQLVNSSTSEADEVDAEQSEGKKKRRRRGKGG